MEDTAILDASLDIITSRKVRDKMKAGQSVEQLVGEKINEYVQIHKLGQKVSRAVLLSLSMDVLCLMFIETQTFSGTFSDRYVPFVVSTDERHGEVGTTREDPAQHCLPPCRPHTHESIQQEY